jgi:hypothetical protein
MRHRDFTSALTVGETGSFVDMARAVRGARGAPGTATATTGAATLHARFGKVTSEALTTAQNGIYTLTLTNREIAAADVVMASVANGTNTQGTPIIGRVQPAAGSVVIQVINQHVSSQALNGTVVVSFMVMKA